MRHSLPSIGQSRDEIFARMKAYSVGDVDWRRGRVPLYVFKANDSIASIGRDAYVEFFTENGLGAKRAFHGLKRMEEEIVAIGLSLFHAPDDAAGYFTTGGSESIIAVVKACRDWTRARNDARDGPFNIVMPRSAHPAFTKAARLMDLEARRVPVAGDFRADAAAMAEAIDGRTLMIVGSAPSFPYGTIDPIEALGRLAVDRDVWLHVDACVGGYLAPFVAEAGYAVPSFDFSVVGVTSLSADLHKFGFCPKPASTIFYRSAEQAAFQPFDVDEWPGGRFSTATLVGTRPGGAIAGAWATLHAMGVNGYVDTARDIMSVVARYRNGIEAIGLTIVGAPELSILCFTCADVDMLHVGDLMAMRGWLPGIVREPRAMHLMLSMLHARACDDYLRDLRECVAHARAGGRSVPESSPTY